MSSAARLAASPETSVPTPTETDEGVTVPAEVETVKLALLVALPAGVETAMGPVVLPVPPARPVRELPDARPPRPRRSPPRRLEAMSGAHSLADSGQAGQRTAEPASSALRSGRFRAPSAETRP